MMRRRFGRPRGFGYVPPTAVLESTGTQVKRKSKCAGCALPINVGEPFVRLRLRKRFAVPCGTCSHVPKRAKRYHAACKPSDLNAAMGYDPAKQAPPRPAYCRSCAQAMTPGVRFCAACGYDQQQPMNLHRGGAVPPPPKPPSPQEVTLEALAKLEAALIAQLTARQRPMTDDLRASFKTFEGIKARVLRPGTPGEEHAATNLALQRLVKMVFA